MNITKEMTLSLAISVFFIFFKIGKDLMRFGTSPIHHTEFASSWLYFSDRSPLLIAHQQL